jgi:hypothetical protein
MTWHDKTSHDREIDRHRSTITILSYEACSTLYALLLTEVAEQMLQRLVVERGQVELHVELPHALHELSLVQGPATVVVLSDVMYIYLAQ